jgi:uncharacterized delta-60 repeat protein
LGGDFTTFDGTQCDRVVRLNSDGSIDTNFYVGQGPQAFVFAVAAQSNGMVLVGGSFSEVNGFSQPNLARLRADGSLDISFTPNINAYVVSPILQRPGGSIILAGGFSQVNGQANYGLAQLTTSGTVDSTFYPGLSSSSSVTSMALDPSGNLLVAGQIEIGTNQYEAVRLTPTGALDDTFAVGPLNGSISQIALEPNGNIVVTGGFTEINGYSLNGIAMLQTNGAVETGFRPNPGTGYGGLLGIEADGKIFTTGGGMMRVNTDGSVDTSFTPQISDINCMQIQANGRLVVGGSFSTVDGTNMWGITRLQGDSLAPFQTQLLNLNFYPGMQIAGSVGTLYRIESTTGLPNPGPWTPVSTFTLTTTPYWFLDTTPINPNAPRFYRAVVVQ